MSSMNMTTAFNRFRAKLDNSNWAVSALSEDGELVISCWSHYMSSGGGVIKYSDRLSRIAHNKPGSNLLRKHLEQAVRDDLAVRLVTVTTKETEKVDTGQDASKIKKSFGTKEYVIGKVALFDGEHFVIEFVRDAG